MSTAFGLEPIARKESSQYDSDYINAPYDPSSHEAWEITKSLLQSRLGEYSMRSDVYLAAPFGSRLLGFQQEFPADVYKNADGDTMLLNVVLKGLFSKGSFPIWLHTAVGFVGRAGEDGALQFIEEAGVVSEPLSTGRLSCFERDIFDKNGREATPAHAERIVKHLRRARRWQYLPDWIHFLKTQNEES